MFTYFQSGIGALLLHISTSTQLYGNGKVLGCSSMLYNTFANPSVFNLPAILGMASSVFAVAKFIPQYLPNYDNVKAIAPVFGSYTATMALSGLLTGVGTNLGSGCTSGHMLCGLARLSVRSLVATCSFCLTGMITQALFSTAPSCPGGSCHQIASPSMPEVKLLISLVAAIYMTSVLLKRYLTPSKLSQELVSFFSGSVFGLGLMISGMGSPGNTLGFLAAVPPKFNPSLIMVVLFGIIPNLIEIKNSKLQRSDRYPTAVADFDIPTRTDITPRLVIGSAIFGIGWGLSGICPGPGILAAVYNGKDGLAWILSFLIGYKIVNSVSV